MTPPAPPRFSITTACPRFSDSAGTTLRVTMSVPPPGAAGTTRRIGFAGYCASAGEMSGAARSPQTSASNAMNLITVPSRRARRGRSPIARRLPARARGLQRLDVRRRRSLLPLRHVERDFLALFQRFEPRSLDRAVMREQVLSAVIRRDEPEALGVVEPLHGTCRHVIPSPEIATIARGCPSLLRARLIKVGNRPPQASRFWRGGGVGCSPIEILRLQM